MPFGHGQQQRARGPDQSSGNVVFLSRMSAVMEVAREGQRVPVAERAGRRVPVAFICPTPACQFQQEVGYTTFQKWKSAHMGQLESSAGCKVLCPRCLKTRTATKGPRMGQTCRTYNEIRTGHKTAQKIFRQRRLDAGNEDDVDGRVGDAAWARVVHWFGETLSAEMKTSGAIPMLQRPGDTFYLPAGYGHLVVSIGGGSFTINGRDTPAPIVASIPAWHNPRSERLEQLKSIHEVPFGEHSEAQLVAEQWSTRKERVGAVGRIVMQRGDPKKATKEVAKKGAEIAEYVHFPSTPTLVAVGAKLGQGACEKVTLKLLQEVALAHKATVWDVGHKNFRRSLDAPDQEEDTWMEAATDHIRKLRGDACDDDQRKFSGLFSYNLGAGLNVDAAISMFEGVSEEQAVEADPVALDTERQSRLEAQSRLKALLKRSTLKHSHVQGVLNTLLLGSKLWIVWLPGADGPRKVCINSSSARKRARSATEDSRDNVLCDMCLKLCTSGSFAYPVRWRCSLRGWLAEKEVCPECFGGVHGGAFRGYHNEPV